MADVINLHGEYDLSEVEVEAGQAIETLFNVCAERGKHLMILVEGDEDTGGLPHVFMENPEDPDVLAKCVLMLMQATNQII